MTHFNTNLVVDHYRWGTDGTETGHGWEENEDTAFSSTNLEFDTTYFLRILLQEGGTGSTGANTYQLQYQVNSDGWNDVTGSSSNVRATATSNIADDAVTTNRLAGGSGTFISGRFDEADGDTTTSITITTSNFTEVMYSIQFRSADLPTSAATVTFQLVATGDTSIDAHNITPTANIPARVVEGDGASSGTATVDGIATGIIGEASGAATVAAKPIVRGDGASSGEATVDAEGQKVLEGDGAASGTATVSGAGLWLVDGTASGTATVSGAGLWLVDGTASGIATVSGIAIGIIGEASGAATASGVGETPGIYTKFKWRTAQALLDSSGTTQDITVSGWTDTPEAAIFFLNSVQSNIYETGHNAHRVMSIGFADGTNERVSAGVAEDGVGASDLKTSFNTSAMARGHVSDAWESVTFNSFISGGVRLNTTALTADHMIQVILIEAGGDLEVAVGSAAADSTVSGLSFAPDLIFAASNGTGTGDANHDRRSFGIAYRNEGSGTQYINQHYAQNDELTTSSTRAGMYTNHLVSQANNWYATVSSWNSDGWQTTTGGSQSDLYAYLALGLRGKKAKLDNATAPTSTGTVSVTSLGFDPGFILFQLSDATTINTDSTNGLANCHSFGISDGINDYTSIVNSEDNNTTMNEPRGSRLNLGYAYDHTSTTLQNVVDFEAWTSGGYDVDFTTVDSGATQLYNRFVIECERAVAPAPSLLPRRNPIKSHLAR